MTVTGVDRQVGGDSHRGRQTGRQSSSVLFVYTYPGYCLFENPLFFLNGAKCVVDKWSQCLWPGS